MSKKRIVLAGLYSLPNMGDLILCETTEYLIREIQPDVEIIPLDVAPYRRSFFHGFENLKYRISRKLELYGKRHFSYDDGSRFRYSFERFYWRLRLMSYYKRTLRNADAVVFAGGGFVKFRTQGLNYYVEMIAEIAAAKGIPVMMNAVGVEGFDDSDVRCRSLKQALNCGVFKTVTTRDDIDILANDYFKGSQTRTARVGDPALWSPECYNVKREITDDAPVGVNIIRGGIFQHYGNQTSYDGILQFYCDLLEELESRGVNWIMFSNGMKQDQRLGRKVLERMGMDPEEKLLSPPESSEDLLNIVRRMKCIFGARLHACITAYALDVPVVGFIWNEKTRIFAASIHKSENFFEEDSLDIKQITDRLLASAEESYDPLIREQDRQKTKKYLAEFLETYCRDQDQR